MRHIAARRPPYDHQGPVPDVPQHVLGLCTRQRGTVLRYGGTGADPGVRELQDGQVVLERAVEAREVSAVRRERGMVGREVDDRRPDGAGAAAGAADRGQRVLATLRGRERGQCPGRRDEQVHRRHRLAGGTDRPEQRGEGVRLLLGARRPDHLGGLGSRGGGRFAVQQAEQMACQFLGRTVLEHHRGRQPELQRDAEPVADLHGGEGVEPQVGEALAGGERVGVRVSEHRGHVGPQQRHERRLPLTGGHGGQPLPPGSRLQHLPGRPSGTGGRPRDGRPVPADQPAQRRWHVPRTGPKRCPVQQDRRQDRFRRAQSGVEQGQALLCRQRHEHVTSLWVLWVL